MHLCQLPRPALIYACYFSARAICMSGHFIQNRDGDLGSRHSGRHDGSRNGCCCCYCFPFFSSKLAHYCCKMWLTPELKEHLIYWKNPRDSGIIFGFVLVFFLGIRYVSIISVLANMALALITSTMAFRIYKSVLSAVNKTQDGHPFKVCLYVVFFKKKP